MGDQIWMLVNGIHTGSILIATAWSRGHPLTWSRIGFVSCGLMVWHRWISANFSFFDLEGTWSGGALELFVIVWFCFRGDIRHTVWKDWIVAYFYSFLIAMVWQTLTVFNGQEVLAEESIWLLNSSDGIAALCILLFSSLLALFVYRKQKLRVRQARFEFRNQFVVTCQLHWRGKTWSGQALLDSGNGLIEPISGEKVAILSRQEAQKHWAELVDIPFVQQRSNQLYEMLSNLDEQLRYAFRVIPFSTIQGTQEAMLAFKPDRFEIDHPHFTNNTKHRGSIWVALTEQQIHSEFEVRMLLPFDQKSIT